LLTSHQNPHQLATLLDNKIDALLVRYDIIKSENEMLRSELERAQYEIAQLRQSQGEGDGISAYEAQLLIDKLTAVLA